MHRFGPGFDEQRHSLERSRLGKCSLARPGRSPVARHTAEGSVGAAADTVKQFGWGIAAAGGHSEDQRSVAAARGLHR